MLDSKNKIAVTAACNSMLATAEKLANKLHLPIANKDVFYPFLLVVTPERLELHDKTIKNSKPICVDFLSSKIDYRIKSSCGNKQLIARAVGIKRGVRPTVVDATAGLGVDAFVLASLGCGVVMLERSPIIGALLQDGLNRLQKQSNIKIDLHVMQAKDYFNEIINKSDIVYLDPMYPQKSKSALGKKPMRILHEIVGSDEDAADILALALRCAKKRVVVKRPSYAPNLGSLEPSLQFTAKGSCRYDVYFPPSREG
jgi:16S rRNA (guanine1516-N2)-methyltransferase